MRLSECDWPRTYCYPLRQSHCLSQEFLYLYSPQVWNEIMCITYPWRTQTEHAKSRVDELIDLQAEMFKGKVIQDKLEKKEEAEQEGTGTGTGVSKVALNDLRFDVADLRDEVEDLGMRLDANHQEAQQELREVKGIIKSQQQTFNAKGREEESMGESVNKLINNNNKHAERLGDNVNRLLNGFQELTELVKTQKERLDEQGKQIEGLRMEVKQGNLSKEIAGLRMEVKQNLKVGGSIATDSDTVGNIVAAAKVG